MTLTCYSQSLSLPEEFRHNESIIEYTWSGAYSGSGQSVTLSNLTRYDDGKSITCRTKDRGASETLSSTSNVNITVYCRFRFQFLTYLFNIFLFLLISITFEELRMIYSRNMLKIYRHKESGSKRRIIRKLCIYLFRRSIES